MSIASELSLREITRMLRDHDRFLRHPYCRRGLSQSHRRKLIHQRYGRGVGRVVVRVPRRYGAEASPL